MKKLIAVFLSVLMAFSVFGMCGNVFAEDPYAEYTENNLPYVDSEGYYHRVSNGSYIAFDTDYSRVLKQTLEHFLNHDTAFSVMYATPAPEADNNAMWTKLRNDIFTNPRLTMGENYAMGGDYLFNNLGDYDIGFTDYVASFDNPREGEVRYTPYCINISNVVYDSDKEWEDAVADFAAAFRSEYLDDSMTEYEKVKTIYDFIVRNTDYDNEVFNGDYPYGSERYRIAHSAYGALYGNLLKNGVTTFNKAYKIIATGEKIILEHDQGLAVCEGFSRLFYYLCMYNGIPCRIVDGDNIADSGKDSDPHEWNYVYLDDGCGEGYKWFQVDATYASNKSYKAIDLNNYDYFLRGRSNVSFGTKEHQQPYYDGMNSPRPQLYEWDVQGNESSYEDYRFQQVSFKETENVDFSHIICRYTDYGGDIGERTSYVYTNVHSDDVDSRIIEMDVDDNGESTVYATEINGFIYNGHASRYSAIVPYLVDEEIVAEQQGVFKNVGKYSLIISGRDGSEYRASFDIMPLDMSNASNYEIEVFQSAATYNGKPMSDPQITIKDSFDYELESGKDYDLLYYNSKGERIAAPQEIGKYRIDIVFKGNYSGTYTKSDFEVEKIRLSLLKNTAVQALNYIPAAIRKANNINSAADYLKVYQAFGVPLTKGKDFTASSTDNLDYGSNVRYITLTGIDSADSLTLGGAQYSHKVGYVVGVDLENPWSDELKYDITSLGLKAADTNKVNKYYYTGKEIKPTKFDIIDSVLVQGKDYKIVSYSDNIKAGIAYVTIQGINGCKGTLKLPFVINSAPSGSTTEQQGGTQNAKVTRITLYTPSMKKLTAGKKSFTAKWTKVTKGKITGYQVQYSTDKKFKKSVKTKKVKGASKTSLTVKKLKKKKTYYVRVRTYYVYKGKTYVTPYSKYKKVKTK